MLGDWMRQGYKGLAILAHNGTRLVGYKCSRGPHGLAEALSDLYVIWAFPSAQFSSFSSLSKMWMLDKYSADHILVDISACIWRTQPAEIGTKSSPKKQVVRWDFKARSLLPPGWQWGSDHWWYMEQKHYVAQDGNPILSGEELGWYAYGGECTSWCNVFSIWEV